MNEEIKMSRLSRSTFYFLFYMLIFTALSFKQSTTVYGEPNDQELDAKALEGILKTLGTTTEQESENFENNKDHPSGQSIQSSSMRNHLTTKSIESAKEDKGSVTTTQIKEHDPQKINLMTLEGQAINLTAMKQPRLEYHSV